MSDDVLEPGTLVIFHWSDWRQNFAPMGLERQLYLGNNLMMSFYWDGSHGYERCLKPDSFSCEKIRTWAECLDPDVKIDFIKGSL